ncbi:unnamed protein product [Lymnaea stagnalis]|uniref:Uncharacterized protein n=1 Tax=Lymnaea stagnalis TaxID=6523 RepID=A0AAV2HNB5_LYMST
MGLSQSIQETLGSFEDATDTMTKAKIVRLSQGTHEAEVSFGDEADLHKHKKNCKKDPTHKSFIPLNSFTLKDLPWRYRYPQVFDLVKILADLTVRVAVRYTSLERTECFPDTNDLYPFSAYRGLDFLRTGTGKITEALKVNDPESGCPCGECKISGSPQKEYGLFHILTATHVVFDNIEAENTKCKLDYNTDSSPDILLDGTEATADIDCDRCQLMCVTHDVGIVDMVKGRLQKFEELCATVYELFPKDGFERLIVIPSHPHGCPKQISVGMWTHRMERIGDYFTAYTYTASTCPGSSGAPVFTMARDISWWSYMFTHRGSTHDGNHCGATWDN